MIYLFTHDCTAKHSSNIIIKSADDTTIMDLINNNESALSRRVHSSTYIKGSAVERVNYFKFLGVNISEDLTWTEHTTWVVKKPNNAFTTSDG